MLLMFMTFCLLGWRMKIKIYYGPRKGFDKSIPQSTEFISLSKLVEISDRKRRNLQIDVPNVPKEKEIKESFDNVVATTDEYSLLSDSGLNGFMTLLNEFRIKHIYFQNPPHIVVRQLKKVYSDIREESYSYENISMDRLKDFSNKFDSEILGQENAKNNLMVYLYQIAKNYNGGKPLVLMLYGPTGVGKTETAKLLSSVLKQRLFRKQFSMFHSNSFVDYIFGASHNSSSLSRDLLERESNIILFDEFDKPNSSFYSAFYQMFDEGRFEDRNYQINLRNSVIFCTSNFRSKAQISQVLGDSIYNRFDAFIEYKPLSNDTVKQLIFRAFSQLMDTLDLDDKNKINEQESLSTLLSYSTRLSNFRELDKFVKNYVFASILKAEKI